MIRKLAAGVAYLTLAVLLLPFVFLAWVMRKAGIL